MKKMMRTAMMATMAFALLLLPACGGGSDDGAQAPAVEENGGESTAGTVGKAVDGKLTLKMADAAIMIKGTNVALPYDFDLVKSKQKTQLSHTTPGPETQRT